MKRLRSFLDKRRSGAPAQEPLQQIPPPEAQQPTKQPENIQPQSKEPGQIKIPGSTLNIALRNDSTSSTVYAYITGQALDNNNAVFLLGADGHTPYYPSNPPAVGTPLSQDVAIPLGAPGNTVTVQIPHIAGGRIWFSINGQITFLLNPGPALVEPSVTNPSDSSINVEWDFCEFTFNNDQLYANISYVDFVSIPISLNLTTTSSGTQHVSGMGTNGLNEVVSGLRAQTASDGQGWDQLIVPTSNNPSQPLRILSPNQGRVQNQNLFANYYDPYVNQVYANYRDKPLSVDTQASFGVVRGQVTSSYDTDSTLTLNGIAFSKPSTSDIWTCSTGPFATGSNAETNTIIPRLAAAFNRSSLLVTDSIPAPVSNYYQNAITNHYSRIVHAANLDGKGYAFPYDDVQATGSPDQSGKVQAGDPELFTVAVGGGQASAQ